MTEKQVRTNYNAVGLRIIEQIYTDDYLSIGGQASTKALASLMGLKPSDRVLDVGCGLGGPAMVLAESVGCHVTGLDLVELSIQQASDRAHKRGLADATRFVCGDACDMDFDNDAFQAVVGQDAWCHIPDKQRLLAECVRVTGDNATIGFTDWVITADMNQSQSEQVLDAAASPSMCRATDYLTILEQLGCPVLHVEDISAVFAQQYRQIVDRLKSNQDQLTEQYGERVFGIVVEKNNLLCDAFESELIGGVRLVARANEKQQ